MTTDARFDAINRVDEAVSQLLGFTFALFKLAHDADCIKHGTSESNSIMTLINVVFDTANVLANLQAEVWAAASQEARS